MNDAARSFIENWEVESYRKKVASGSNTGVLTGKIACVTGGAQGFGFGIAEELVKAGAMVVIADMNFGGAEAAAAKLLRALFHPCTDRAAGVFRYYPAIL